MTQDADVGSETTEHATIAGGCFWCLEAVFEMVNGITNVESGYTGGHLPDPNYQQVCSDTTGHAEAVQLSFDPGIISFKQILSIFFSAHDPTTLNRQGPDIGHSYRSAIFYHSKKQQRCAESLLKELGEAAVWDSPIVTELAPFSIFYRAEEYHQQYFRTNPGQPYCQVIIAPKLAKFRKEFLATSL